MNAHPTAPLVCTLIGSHVEDELGDGIDEGDPIPLGARGDAPAQPWPWLVVVRPAVLEADLGDAHVRRVGRLLTLEAVAAKPAARPEVDIVGGIGRLGDSRQRVERDHVVRIDAQQLRVGLDSAAARSRGVLDAPAQRLEIRRRHSRLQAGMSSPVSSANRGSSTKRS